MKGGSSREPTCLEQIGSAMSKGNLAHHHTCPAFCPRYLSMNAIAKQLGVSTPSILNWIRAHAARHAARPQPEPGESVVVMELDELWHFLQKKNKLWIWLAFDRSASSTGNVAIVMPPR